MGGAEKSLISLLYELNPEKYDIDLFLFQHQGKWLSKLPAYVNLLPIPQKYKYFDSSFLETMVENFKKGNLRLMLDRIRFTINNTSQKPPAVKEQINWKFIKNHIEPLQQKYDAAFGFLEKTPWAAKGDGGYLPCQLISGSAETALPIRTPDRWCFTKNNLTILQKNQIKG